MDADRKVRFVTSSNNAENIPSSPSGVVGAGTITGAVSAVTVQPTSGVGKSALVHGTKQYVNGTLMTDENRIKEAASTPTAVSLKVPTTHVIRPRSQSDCQVIVRKVAVAVACDKTQAPPTSSSLPQRATPPVPVAATPAKPSIMKKPATVASKTNNSSPRPTRVQREPMEVRKLVTFTDHVQYDAVTEDDNNQLKYSRSEEDLRDLRVPFGHRSPTPGSDSSAVRSRSVSRSKMISSSSAPDMKLFSKGKGLKNVTYRPIRKAFHIIADEDRGSVPFNALFDSKSGSPSSQLTTSAPLPCINIKLIATNTDLHSHRVLHSQNNQFLKVPKLKSLLNATHSSGSSGGCDFENNSFKVLTDTTTASNRISDARLASDLTDLDIVDRVNLMQFWDYIERWQAVVGQQTSRFGDGVFLENLQNQFREANGPSTRISSKLLAHKPLTTSRKSGAPTMDSEPIPLVSALLRASAASNEILIKAALKDIIVNGISKEELNATDKSGRTAISYICSTNLTQFLDIFLQLPNIDVNRADNEGNTPLHFASEAGRSEVVNMLITRCRSLTIDPKNNLGFTPLMKAALQGRTKCAKLLLFAGASPVETDPKRQYRADQWARFCGQYTCAEMIEKVARTRLLQTTSIKWGHDTIALDKKYITRSNTASLATTEPASVNVPPSSVTTGIKSKLKKVFPFGLSLRGDKSNGLKSGEHKASSKKRADTSDLVSYLSAAALCASGPALPKEQTKLIRKLIHHPIDVPKLEVTYANNNALIRKMENGAGQETKAPPLAVRIKN